MNVDDLAELARGYREADDVASHEVRVCMAASCQSSGAQPLLDALVAAQGTAGSCRIKGVGCMGLCSGGPLVAVVVPGADLADSVLYRDVQPSDATEILASVGNAPLQRLRCPTDQPFFARQHRVVLANSGLIDPESLHAYVAEGGYAALVHALTPTTKTQFMAGTAAAPPNLFSHDDQQMQWQRAASGAGAPVSGWGGRVADLQPLGGAVPMVLSASGNAVFINGATTQGLAVGSSGSFAIRGFGSKPATNPLFQLYQGLLQLPYAAAEERAAAGVLREALNASAAVNGALSASSSVAGLFNGLGSGLAQQLFAVARLIETGPAWA